MDELVATYARSLFPDDDREADEDPDEDPDEVALGYPLALAADLWAAWRDKGIMPYSGGYLEQPRRWQRLMHLMNRRFNRAYLKAKAERPPPGAPREDDPDAVLNDLLGQTPPFAAGGRGSWERFANG